MHRGAELSRVLVLSGSLPSSSSSSSLFSLDAATGSVSIRVELSILITPDGLQDWSIVPNGGNRLDP